MKKKIRFYIWARVEDLLYSSLANSSGADPDRITRFLEPCQNNLLPKLNENGQKSHLLPGFLNSEPSQNFV